MCKFITSTLLAALLLLATPLLHAQGTFTTGGSADTCGSSTSNVSVASMACNKGGVTATITAWGFTGATLSATASTGFSQVKIGDYDSYGLGVVSGASETGTDYQHAMDNATTGCGTASGCGGGIEALLLNFSTSVNLNAITLSLWGGGDFSIWAWTGTGTAPTSLTGVSASSTGVGGTLNSNWKLVTFKDYANDYASDKDRGTFANSSYASAWLITTYFGATSGNVENKGDDRFKVTSFTVAMPPVVATVPEPTSLALVALALLLMGWLSRRRAARVGRA